MLRLNKQQYLTPAEYSHKYAIREELVRRYCRNRRLPAIKVSNRWFIPSDSYPDNYTPRMKDGTYIGLGALRRGDVKKFLLMRGIIPE
jgi:hypothetical protein